MAAMLRKRGKDGLKEAIKRAQAGHSGRMEIERIEFCELLGRSLPPPMGSLTGWRPMRPCGFVPKDVTFEATGYITIHLHLFWVPIFSLPLLRFQRFGTEETI